MNLVAWLAQFSMFHLKVLVKSLCEIFKLRLGFNDRSSALEHLTAMDLDSPKEEIPSFIGNGTINRPDYSLFDVPARTALQLLLRP